MTIPMTNNGGPTIHSDALGLMVPIMSNSPDQWIASDGMILRTLVGSTVHGTSIEGTDDRDEMGVCIEPPSHVLGLSTFKHYTYRTQPEGECSGPGDLDLVVYGLKRYAHLAAQGNPTILLPLWVPSKHVLFRAHEGDALRQNRDLFVTKNAGRRFLGYLESQRRGMLGLRSGGTRNQGRRDIRAKYGFDTKFAGHMVRLGLQGVELLETGTITLPIPEPDLTWIRDLRVGKHTKDEALDRALELEEKIKRLIARSSLPEAPDRRKVDDLLITMYRGAWK